VLDPAVIRWILALAAPFDRLDPDDVAPRSDPTARAAAAAHLAGLGPDLREGLIREVGHALQIRRPWETTRLIRTLTAAVQAGRMPVEEVWPILLHLARPTQRTFSSWADYGDALIVDFDGVTDGRNDCRRDVAALLRPPGLWTTIPWALDLGGDGA
jgi:hypothetical protein